LKALAIVLFICYIKIIQITLHKFLQDLFFKKKMYALTDMRKENFVDKRYWEKSCKYSIRKLTVGTASVLLGAVFLATQNVAADGIEVKENQASVSETTVQVNTKVEEPTQEGKENQPSTENQTSTELATAVAIYQHYGFTALQQPLSNAAGHPAMNIWMIKSLLSDE